MVSEVKASVRSEVCVGVKSRSAFPDLVSFEIQVVRPAQRQAKLGVRQIGLSCREFLASLPQAELFVLVAMLMLANA